MIWPYKLLPVSFIVRKRAPLVEMTDVLVMMFGGENSTISFKCPDSIDPEISMTLAYK
jgi:hypothetical protein